MLFRGGPTVPDVPAFLLNLPLLPLAELTWPDPCPPSTLAT
jgi:hypothetical protein